MSGAGYLCSRLFASTYTREGQELFVQTHAILLACRHSHACARLESWLSGQWRSLIWRISHAWYLYTHLCAGTYRAVQELSAEIHAGTFHVLIDIRMHVLFWGPG